MATELERALERAKYSALPLPRTKSDPTTIFAFSDGHLYIVRNAHNCLPDPPLTVTPDPAVDTLEFTREFNFEFKGIVGFFTKLLGIGNAKSELELKSISRATVQMGGLAHYTIETGALIDYLLQQKQPTTCLRDVLDEDHFTIVAALQATTLTYTFKNSRGAIVTISAPEATNLFKVDASARVEVTKEGKIVVNAPRYVGVVTWDGAKIGRELEKAKRQLRAKTLAPYRPAGALTNALEPSEVQARRLASIGMSTRALKRPRQTKRKSAARKRG